MAQALYRLEPFRDFAFPRVLAPPILARYTPGMHYGAHSDAAFLPIGQRPLRSDLSCTLFIGAPDSYEGGELSIRLGGRSVEFKGKPGSAVVYPSNTLHEVRPVTGVLNFVVLQQHRDEQQSPQQRSRRPQRQPALA